MHKNNQEKTAFITDRGTFLQGDAFRPKKCRGNLSAVSKPNVRQATWSHNEVYIDNMLVKSTCDAEHVSHLQ